MADGYNIYQDVLKKFKNPYQNVYQNIYSKGLTPVQREVQTYAEQIKSEEKPKIRPLQWIFDRLQTGNYVSANMVDQALRNSKKDDPLLQETLEVLKAGWEGITGERKGTYKDILTEHFDMADRPGKIDLSDVLGFAGDVFLDPLTYVTFGASKMGVSAATKYADDVARVTLKKMGKSLGNADDLARLATKNFSKDHFNKLLQQSQDKAYEYFMKNAGGDVAREVNKVRNLAYKEALKTPAEELRAKMLNMTQGMAEEEAARRTAALAPKLGGIPSGQQIESAISAMDKAVPPTTFIEDLVKGIPEAYTGAGTRRTGSFFGKEFGVGVRPLNSIERAAEIIGQKISKLPGADTLKDVWWKMNNTGPIGEIRKKLGIRDPYGKLVNMEYMEKGNHYHMAKLRENMELAQQATEGFDDELKQKWVQLTDRAEELWKPQNPVTAFDVLNDPIVRDRMGITEDEIEPLLQLGNNVEGILRKYRADYMKIAQEGIVEEMGDIVNYLPVAFKDSNLRTSKFFTELGARKPGYAMKRGYTRAETAAQEASKLSHFLGISNEQAMTAVRDYNMSGLNMNLDELLALRGYAQAQVEKRANLIRTFKEFGIPIDEAEGVLGRALDRPGANLNMLGLTTSNEMGLEGLLFDKEVADVLSRVAKSTDPRNVSKIQKAFINFNSWWKGMATMTSGFHARNAISNNVTGFMVHGLGWFDIKKDLDAFAASIYAMKKADITKALKEVNMTEPLYRRLLNKRYGDYTLKELADMQLKSGLLSEAQMGIDAKDAFSKFMQPSNVNPLSLKFKGRDISQKVGGVVENSAKFKSFLIDYDDILKGTKKLEGQVTQATSDQALKYAERNAKKWWLDYSDLTQFEQDVMKNVIPFYSWLRKNIRNQMEGILVYPQTFSIFPKAMDAMTYDDPDFDPEAIPQWMQDLGMFPTGAGLGEQRFMFRPDMPFMDLNKLPFAFEEGSFLPRFDPSELKDDLVNAAHPAVKTLASLMTEKGYDFFRKKDLEGDAPAPLFLRFLTKNVETLQNLDGILRMSGVEGFKPRVDENGKLRMNARWLNFLENNLPIIRNLNLMIEAGTMVPGVEEAIEEATGYQDDYDKAEQLFRVLGSTFGIKFYPFDVAKATEDKARSTYYEAVRRRGEDVRQTQESKERRAEQALRTSELIRRMGI
jgi:hypothetical protein